MTRDEALQDPDLAQVGQALARAARRAREVARRTHTSVVFLRNGVIVEEQGDEMMKPTATPAARDRS